MRDRRSAMTSQSSVVSASMRSKTACACRFEAMLLTRERVMPASSSAMSRPRRSVIAARVTASTSSASAERSICASTRRAASVRASSPAGERSVTS